MNSIYIQVINCDIHDYTSEATKRASEATNWTINTNKNFKKSISKYIYGKHYITIIKVNNVIYIDILYNNSNVIDTDEIANMIKQIYAPESIYIKDIKRINKHNHHHS